jgi:pantoate--beta-alanine ligase
MLHEFTSLSRLRSAMHDWRAAGESIALVPTMGALHAGHLRLVTEAKKHAKHVVVSIFVNPTQFGPNEDFNRYPRPLEKDLSLLRDVCADAVWLPTVEEMYPAGFSTNIHVAGVSEGLCGAARPTHFDGVATVVAKLLLQVTPDAALFGEKDYQQLCVIKRLVADLNLPVAIIGVPIVREGDGLALSSRNQYLSVEERAIAPTLHQQLQQAAAALKAGGNVDEVLASASAAILAAGFHTIDYVALRAEETLAPLLQYQSPARLLVAAWLGKTRLIDNILIAPGDFS